MVCKLCVLFPKYLKTPIYHITPNIGLEHKSEDKNQSYGRFPFIIPIYENDFSILLNKGFVENTNNYLEYIEYMNIVGNFQKIATVCGNNFPIRKKIEMQTVKPIAEKYNEILQNMNTEKSESEIMELLL